jgi:hypothetical protein
MEWQLAAVPFSASCCSPPFARPHAGLTCIYIAQCEADTRQRRLQIGQHALVVQQQLPHGAACPMRYPRKKVARLRLQHPPTHTHTDSLLSVGCMHAVVEHLGAMPCACSMCPPHPHASYPPPLKHDKAMHQQEAQSAEKHTTAMSRSTTGWWEHDSVPRHPPPLPLVHPLTLYM